MAFFCDKETVLSLFRDGVDVYYQQSKYELGETIRNQSPPTKGKLPYSRSLEKYSALLNGNSAAPTVSQSVDKQKTNGNNDKCTTITFDASTIDSTFQFQKCEVIDTIPQTSSLSNNITRVKFIQFKVYFPKKSVPFFVQVSQPENASVEQVMKKAIETFNETPSASTKFSTAINEYKFYMADDDGSPEEFGVLGAGQTAARMGKELTIVPTRDSGRPPSVGRVTLAVHLPGKEKATVPLRDDMTISDIIKKVCQRRNIEAADFHLATSDGTALPSDLCIRDIPMEDSLSLQPNVVEGKGEDVAVMTTFHDTFVYKAFDVTYKKKTYTLGIDGEHIQVYKKRTGFSREKKELHPFSTLTSITAGKGDKAFTITWLDGTKDFFESSDRKKIISKISVIQQRKQDIFF